MANTNFFINDTDVDALYIPKYAIYTNTESQLFAWGYNNYGQLGTGNQTSYSSPVQVGSLTDWNQISAGAYHTIATKTDGTLWAWGHNFYQQLGLGGLGDITNRSSPVQVGTLTDWNLIACGRWNTISITIQHLIP